MMEFLVFIKSIYVALGLLGVAFGIQVYFYARYYFAIIRENRRRRKRPVVPEVLPPVSVVICAKEESENLRRFLPSILEQDYPDFEVVVVNDGNTDKTKEVLAVLKNQYSNLVETFVPMNARVISRKKLALTVGIKAAKNELLLLTDADCRAVSKGWIREMVKDFGEGTEVVVGYGGYEQERGLLSRMISYDTLFSCMQYMGFALCGHPYMGVGRNMAYRRSTFFAHNGFAGILDKQSGDDDLYVGLIADRGNTQVVFSAESKTLSVPKGSFREWVWQRERHLSTAPSYKKGTLNRIGAEVVSRGLFYASFIACLCYWDLVLSLVAVGLMVVRFVLQCCAVNLSAKILEERRFWWDLLLWDMCIPVLNLGMLLGNLVHRRRQFVWR